MNSVEEILAALRSGSITQQQADSYMQQMRATSSDPTGDYMTYSQGLRDITSQNFDLRGLASLDNKQNNTNSFSQPFTFENPMGRLPLDLGMNQGTQVTGINQNQSAFDPNFTGTPGINPNIQGNDTDKLARYTQDHINGGETPERAAQLAQQEIDGQNRAASTEGNYGNDFETYQKNNPQDDTQVNLDKKGAFPYIYAGGTDLNTRANMLGQFVGLEKGTKGKGIGVALSAGSLALGLAGDIASGIGMSKANKVAQDYYRKKLRGVDTNDYTAISQTDNSNGMGGRSYRKGGVFILEDGGTMPAEPVETMVAQALQSGVSPEEVIKQLVSQGVAEDQAAQMINSISQQGPELEESDENKQDIPVEKLLTGDVMKGLSKGSPIKPNAEVEKKEALKFPDQSVVKVDGPPHEEGGVKVNLPEGTKVLSDDTTIDKKEVKRFKKELDLNVSESDTYASVLEKYSKKIGLAKLNDEQEEVFKVLKKQMEASNIGEGTSRVNTEFLAKKIKDIEDKKAPKEAERQKFFDTLFASQESKKKPENKEGEFKYGGEFEAVCKKMGIDPEHAKSIMGGSVPTYGPGGTVETLTEQYKNGTLKPEEFKTKMDQEYKSGNLTLGEYTSLGNLIPGNPLPTAKGLYTGTYNENTLSSQPRETQRPGEQAYGRPKTKEDIILNLYRNFPDIIAKDDVFGSYLDKEKLKQGQVAFTKDLSLNKVNASVLSMQKQVDARMKSSANDIIKNKDKFDAATVERANKYLKEETFSGEYKAGTPVEQQIRSYDQKMGNFTSGRYSIGLNVITPEESKILASKGVTTLNQLDEETLKTLSPETQAKVKDLRSIKSTDSDYSLNTYTPFAEKPVEKTSTEALPEGELKNLIKNTAIQKNPRMFYHPSQVQLAPTPLTATYMGDIQTQYVDPTRIGIENNLQSSSDQMQVIASQLDSLPPSQRASALSSLLATTQASNNQAITNANMVNAQADQQAEVFNIGQFDRNQQNGFNIKQNYVNKTEQAQAILEENMRNYFNFNQKVAMNNKAIDDRYNLMASIYDYTPNFYGNQIQFDPNDEFQIQKRNDLARQINGVPPAAI